MSLTATTSVGKDEELRISYVDANLTAEQRRAILQEHYEFRCECPKCRQGFASALLKMSAVAGNTRTSRTRARAVACTPWARARAAVDGGLTPRGNYKAWGPRARSAASSRVHYYGMCQTRSESRRWRCVRRRV